MDARVYLANEDRVNRKPPTLQEAFDEMLSIFDLTRGEVCNARRYRKYVMYRQLFSYVAPILTRTSLEEVGDFLGGFHHSTISNHRSDVKNWIEDGDATFMPIWNYYRIESDLWNRFNPNK